MSASNTYSTHVVCAEMSSDIRIARLAEALRLDDGTLPKEFEQFLRAELCRRFRRMEMSAQEFRAFLAEVDFSVVALEFSESVGVDPLDEWTPPLAMFGAPATEAVLLQRLFDDSVAHRRKREAASVLKKFQTPSIDAASVNVDYLAELVRSRREEGSAGSRPLTQSQAFILKTSVCDGRKISLSPDHFFEKRDLDELRRLLEAIGAKYVKGGVWILDESAGLACDLVDAMLRSGTYVDRRDLGAFFSPDGLSDEVVALARIEPGMSVLEPNGGAGALLTRCIRAAVPDSSDVGLISDLVVACELLPRYANELEKTGAHVICSDFLTADFGGRRFDRIVMNPPFAKDQDIAHVIHAMSLLNEDGRLVCITSPMSGERGAKARFQELVAACGADAYQGERGLFAESGYSGGVEVFAFDAANLPERLLYPQGRQLREQMR